MNKPTTAKAIAFIAQNPTKLATLHGVDLYEHPTKGDEAPLVAITADGRVKMTDLWEVPLPFEAADLRSL